MGDRHVEPGAAVGGEPLERRRSGPQRRWSGQKALLQFGFRVVEQGDHQAGMAAESPEHGAFADAGLVGDGLHREEDTGRVFISRAAASRVFCYGRRRNAPGFGGEQVRGE